MESNSPNQAQNYILLPGDLENDSPCSDGVPSQGSERASRGNDQARNKNLQVFEHEVSLPKQRNENLSDTSAELSSHFSDVHRATKRIKYDRETVLRQYHPAQPANTHVENWRAIEETTPEQLIGFAEAIRSELKAESAETGPLAHDPNGQEQLEFLRGVGGIADDYEDEPHSFHKEEEEPIDTTRALLTEVRKGRELPNDKARINREKRRRRRHE